MSDDSYLIQTNFFRLRLIEQQDSKGHGWRVWKRANTILTFNDDQNSDIKKLQIIQKHKKSPLNIDSSTQANNFLFN